MQAVILAAGKSSRFSPFNTVGHKSLISIFGKTLLQHTLESLQKAGIKDVVIVVSKDSPIPRLIPATSGLSITFAVQEEPLGMGNALLSAEQYIKDSFLLLSGYHVDVADLIKDLVTHRGGVALLAKRDTSLDKYGVIEVDGRKVLSLTEKSENITGEKLRLISIYLLNKLFLEFLKTVTIEEYSFEKALDLYTKKENVKYVIADIPTVTLKNTWNILDIKNYLLSKIKHGISKKASIAKSAILEGEIYVSDSVKILENAVIKGPCYLGENVIVGTNAILRNGVVAEKDVVIGATMEVKNSFLMQGVTTHTGFIGDSVIGPYSRLAAGFCSANVRFDRENVISLVKGKAEDTDKTHFGVIMGEHVDTGINVSTMPGVIIGNHVTVGPSTTVMENVEDNSLIYTKFETVIKRKSVGPVQKIQGK